MTCKQYVAVDVFVDLEGGLRPTVIHWEDGRRFSIDRVYDVRQAASLKAARSGLRSTSRVRNRVVDLFCEDGRWFLDLSRRAQ